jgi:hypothetical protein
MTFLIIFRSISAADFAQRRSDLARVGVLNREFGGYFCFARSCSTNSVARFISSDTNLSTS